jgi:hypothetical protein
VEVDVAAISLCPQGESFLSAVVEGQSPYTALHCPEKVHIEIKQDGAAMMAALFADDTGDSFFPSFDLEIFLFTFLLGMNSG